MKTLIIGKNGQLGTTLSSTIPKNIECTPVDLPEFDITDAKTVSESIKSLKPDVIINASAYTAVDKAETEIEAAYAINATGPKHLAKAARACGARLIHISTDYVFDGTGSVPYPPDAPCAPLGVYGQSKRQGELYCLQEAKNAVIIRTSWLYSPWGNNFVLTMLRLMAERDHLNVVFDQIGSPTSTHTLAKAVWAVVKNTSVNGVYHWTDAGIASWYDFALAIQEDAIHIGLLRNAIPVLPIKTEDYPTPAKRPHYSVLDCTRSWHDFGIKPLHWRVALKDALVFKRSFVT